MINAEVIQLTTLRGKGRKIDTSNLCVNQLIFVVAPAIEWYGTLKNNLLWTIYLHKKYLY